MSIKESALSAITSITQSDFIRAVTAAGASRRLTVANLAKAIIESYTGSSLGGANQSVKAALDALNSKFTVLEKTVTGTTNLYGAISLGLSWRTNEILSVSTNVSGQWCFPMAIGGYFWARVMTDGSSYSVAANTDVELTVRYRPYTA